MGRGASWVEEKRALECFMVWERHTPGGGGGGDARFHGFDLDGLRVSQSLRRLCRKEPAQRCSVGASRPDNEAVVLEVNGLYTNGGQAAGDMQLSTKANRLGFLTEVRLHRRLRVRVRGLPVLAPLGDEGSGARPSGVNIIKASRHGRKVAADSEGGEMAPPREGSANIKDRGGVRDTVLIAPGKRRRQGLVVLYIIRIIYTTYTCFSFFFFFFLSFILLFV